MTPSSEIHELRHRLYGGDLPGELGDIPSMRSDIGEIKAVVNDLAGFYRTIKRAIVIGAGLATSAAALVSVLDALHVI